MRVAPAIAGVLWLFLFNPTLGIVTHCAAAARASTGTDPANGDQALMLVVIAAVWKQVSYNFLFFLAGLQSIPKSLIEAAAIDGAGPLAPLLDDRLPAAVADDVLPAGRQHRLRLLRHVRRHRRRDAGRAGAARREILVYKVYHDGVKAAATWAARRRSRWC